MAKTNKKLIDEILQRGVEEVIEEDHLRRALNSGKKLRVKLGIDPTAANLHLGHAVILRKLKQFQDAGHKVVLIIGDFTAQVGDPSGRDTTRPTLTEREIEKNMEHYLKQADKIIDTKRAEIKHNSKWHEKGLKNMLKLTKSATIQQLLKRSDFQKRLKEGSDITMLESMYPLLQGYDSVAVGADVELGGTDQKFNLLMGRRVQRHFGEEEQDIMTLPLIEGTDGKKKMSKSYGNYIALEDKPAEMFGKIMSIPDDLMPKYFELLTDLDYDADKHPRDNKLLLAETIVGQLHSPEKANEAREDFVKTFSEGSSPKDMLEIKAEKEMSPIELLIKAGVKSKSEARRLIDQGGVKVNGKKLTNHNLKKLQSGDVVQIGKKRFFEIKV